LHYDLTQTEHKKRVDYKRGKITKIKTDDIRLNRARRPLLNIQQNFIVCVKSN
jgi:hypothetical protein